MKNNIVRLTIERLVRLVFKPFKLNILVVVFSLLSLGCEDLVEIDPPRTEIVADNAFTSDETAEAVTNGMYNLMLSISSMYNSPLEIFSGLYSDELVNFLDNDDYNDFALNRLFPDNNRLFSAFWQNSYQIINNANGVLEGLRENTIITLNLRNQLIGEALFVRAYTHFYLVNLFGPIPYSSTTEIAVNNSASREPVDAVYQKIVADLLEAQGLLSEDLSSTDDGRIRPTKAAVTALLARVYLYTQNWTDAEAQATVLIDDDDFVLEDDLNEVFWAASQEAIWQVVPRDGITTRLGLVFPITFGGPGGFNEFGATALTQELLLAFEMEDNRFDAWVGSRGPNSYPVKYKNSTSLSIGSTDDPEYTVMLRLAEQYLIRAEARARQDDLSGAEEDINIIRNRAGLENTSASGQEELLEAIAQERRIELFTEGGHRWLDLKRTNEADEALAPLKEFWEPTDVLWPVPEIEIFNNSNLLPQNLGY